MATFALLLFLLRSTLERSRVVIHTNDELCTFLHLHELNDLVLCFALTRAIEAVCADASLDQRRVDGSNHEDVMYFYFYYY